MITNKWEDVSCSWTGGINIVKMLELPKAIYRFNAVLSKYLQHFQRTRANNLKFVWGHKDPDSQSNLGEKNKFGDTSMIP